MKEGHLYCLYNDAFKFYGKHYYKLGETSNLRKRLYTYQTSYITPSVYNAVSCRRFRDCKEAEALLFYLLRRYRVKDNREFFHAPITLIRHMLIRVSNINDDRIHKIVDKLASKKMINRLSSNKDIDDLIDSFEAMNKHQADITRQPDHQAELSSFLDEFFEKYRFKPADPAPYIPYGYRPVEDIELNALVDESCSEGQSL